MRKFSLFAVVLVLLSVTLFGCSSDKTPDAQTTEENTQLTQNVANQSQAETDVSQEVSSDGKNGADTSMPPKRPEKQDMGKTVIGKIKSVAGNQVTLEIAELPENASMPDMENFTMPDGGMEGFTMPEGMTPPEGFDGKKPEGDFNFPGFGGGEMPEGMTPPEGFDGEMPDFGDMEGFTGVGSMPQFDMGDIELEYTGKTEKYTIPVGVKVGNGDYTSLSKGMVIMLQFDESNAVSSVMIISQ